MVDFRRRILLGLLPVIRDQPPFMQNQPVFASTPESLGAEFAPVVEACEREWMWKCNARHERPHPTQGGEHISEDWLRGLSDQECLWQFRYLFSNLYVSTGKHDTQPIHFWQHWRSCSHTSSIPFSRQSKWFVYVLQSITVLHLWDCQLGHDSCWWTMATSSQIWLQHLLSPSNLETYTQAIHRTGALVNSMGKGNPCGLWVWVYVGWVWV